MSKYTLRHLHRSNVLSNYPWSHDGQSVSPVTCQDCLFLDGHNLNCRSDLESKIASAASKEAANLLRRWKKELHSPVHMGRFMNCSWDIVSCKNLLWNFCKVSTPLPFEETPWETLTLVLLLQRARCLALWLRLRCHELGFRSFVADVSVQRGKLVFLKRAIFFAGRSCAPGASKTLT